MTTTTRPSSVYSIFPSNPHSTAINRKRSTRTARHKSRRNQSTQIQVRKNAEMEFWKLVTPINQATVITRLYHEVLTEIYKDEVTGDDRPGTGKLSTHEQRAIEEAYKQLSPETLPNQESQRRSPDSQPLYPQRQDSLLPPPPLAHRRQAYHDRQRREQVMVADLPPRRWHENMSSEMLTPAPLNFSRLDRKGLKERTTPVSSPTVSTFHHNVSEYSVNSPLYV